MPPGGQPVRPGPHQAEFAGLYAAEQLGYFKDEDLEITFLEGGSEVDFIAPVMNGSAQFGVAQPADVILWRGQMAKRFAAPRLSIAIARSYSSRLKPAASAHIRIL